MKVHVQRRLVLVSVQQIRFQPNDHKTIKETADELKIFEGIKHPNLVRYFGVEVHRVGNWQAGSWATSPFRSYSEMTPFKSV